MGARDDDPIELNRDASPPAAGAGFLAGGPAFPSGWLGFVGDAASALAGSVCPWRCASVGAGSGALRFSPAGAAAACGAAGADEALLAAGCSQVCLPVFELNLPFPHQPGHRGKRRGGAGAFVRCRPRRPLGACTQAQYTPDTSSASSKCYSSALSIPRGGASRRRHCVPLALGQERFRCNRFDLSEMRRRAALAPGVLLAGVAMVAVLLPRVRDHAERRAVLAAPADWPDTAVSDLVRDAQFKPGDAFGHAYELPADRLRSYPGGVSWHRNKGWNFATPQSIPAPATFPGTLARVSKTLKRTMHSLDDATEDSDDRSADKPADHSKKIFTAWRPWSVPDVSDEDYKRDVQRGVLKKHRGFPDLPDCPTEGLWGSYRAGYAPGQKQGAGNCQDYSLRSTGVPAGDLTPKLGFDVKTWDNLWKEDLKGLKKARSYAKLTKGLWSNTAPDAAMAYYLPNSYKGSLAEYYQEPRGERTATENNAHDNSIVPVPGHKGPYYSSDFTRGEAKPAPPPVARVYGNRPTTNEAYGLAPVVQGLYSGNHLHQQHAAIPQALAAQNRKLAAQNRGRRGRGGRGSGLTVKEEKVADALRSLNRQERRRLAVTRGILLKSPSAHTTSLSTRAAGADSAGDSAQNPPSASRFVVRQGVPATRCVIHT